MNPDNLFAAAKFSPHSLQSPNAWVGHLPFAAWLIREIAPAILVELGAHSGNSYFSFCQAVLEAGVSTRCYAVDTWQGDTHSGHYGEEIYARLEAHHQVRYAEFSRLMRMTFDDAALHFGDGTIDLLHIDGLHSYEAVRHDFDTWLPKLAPGAIVIFHDTNVRERDFGVWKLWDELTARYPCNLEFKHSYGLGVLQLNNAPNHKSLEWLSPGSSDKANLLEYFSTLGARQLERFDAAEQIRRNADLEKIIAERDAELASLDADLAESRRLAASLVIVRDALLASNSWRVTAPLRALGQPWRWARDIAQTLSAILKICGGVRGTLKKTWQVAWVDGWRGVKERLVIARGAEPAPPGYAEWIRRHDTLTDAASAEISRRIAAMRHLPLISVIMPVYNPPLEYLDKAIRSVRRQLYPHWELCIADDASPNSDVQSLLRSHAAEDPRIKVVFRTVNGHISRASNSAIELASGEFFALLDHDDLIAEHALFWIADAINTRPQAGLIYSDEDKIDVAGARSSPYFKCDWNPDLFLSQNMLCHLGVYRADLVRQVGVFREGFEGSQDHDLALRCVERLCNEQIVHVPRVLYHWRSHAASTAATNSAKKYAFEAGRRAIDEHLVRKGVDAEVRLVSVGSELSPVQYYRVRYAVPDPAPRVSIVIPTHNGLALIQACVASVLGKTDYPNYQVLIVDNRSDEPAVLEYFESLKSDSRIRILRDDRPFNFSALNNRAVNEADADLVALVNNDTVVITPEWLTEMVGLAMQPGVGAVGARLWYPDDTIQHAGVILGIGGIAGHAHRRASKTDPGYYSRAALTQSISAVTAACLLIRREIYRQAGGMDEDNLQVAFNDVDFCLRVRALGYRNVWTPFAELYHHESATRGYEDSAVKRRRFEREIAYMRKRWGSVLEHDPAYSPNLTLEREDFSIAWSPRVEILG
jgi:GT2 family glycosyltransferase